MATTIPCPGGGSVTLPSGAPVPGRNDVDRLCRGSSTGGSVAPIFAPRLRPTPRFPVNRAGTPVVAGDFGGFLRGVGRAVGGVVKDIIPGGIDDAIIDSLTGARRGRIPTDPLGFARGCPPGFEKKNGQCVETGIMGTVRRTLPGGRTGTLEDVMGEPTLGRFGVAVVPSERTTSVLDCPAGMVLGKDNLCYDSLRKSERKWPPGRKPLLTGGEMNAITKAARAARRLHRTKKTLKKTERALKKVT